MEDFAELKRILSLGREDAIRQLVLSCQSLTSLGGSDREGRTHAVQLLELFGRSPVGAEVGVYLLENDPNPLKSSDPVVVEQVVITLINVVLSSLQHFPLKDLSKGKGSANEFAKNHANRWHEAAQQAQEVTENLMKIVMGVLPQEHMTQNVVLLHSVLLGSAAGRNKLHQLAAELWLWVRPKNWGSLTSILTTGLERRRPDQEGYLLPSSLLFGTLKECAFEMCADSENVGAGGAGSTKRSAWELGRVTSAQRQDIAADLADLLSFCWSKAGEDVQYLMNMGLATPDTLSHCRVFAEAVQSMVLLLISANQAKRLETCAWSFFTCPFMIHESNLRCASEALSASVQGIFARKGKAYRFAELPSSTVESLMLVCLDFCDKALTKCHPILGAEASEDPIQTLTRFLPCIEMSVSRLPAEQAKNMGPRLLALAIALLVHPSLAIAFHGATIWKIVICWNDPAILAMPMLSLATTLVFFRVFRLGDPQVFDRLEKDNAWLRSKCDEQIRSVVRLLGLPSGQILEHEGWESAVRTQNDVDDMALSVDDATSDYLSRYSNLKQCIRTQITEAAKCHPAVSEAMGQTLAKFAQYWLTDLPVLAKQSFTPKNQQLKEVAYKVRGFLHPAFLILDGLAFLVECSETLQNAHGDSGFPHCAAVIAQQLATLHLTYLDTHLIANDNGQVMIVEQLDDPTSRIDPSNLPSHWQMLEYRRLDALISSPELAVRSHLRNSPFLLTRIFVVPPQTWPQARASASAGTLDEEEDSFYLIRRRAVKCISSLYTTALRTLPYPLAPDVRNEVERLLALLNTRQTESGTAEKAILSECMLSLAASTGLADAEKIAFNALGPSLLQNFVKEIQHSASSPESLAQLLFGRDENEAGLGTHIEGRRSFLRNINGCEAILKSLTLPATWGGCLSGNFLTPLPQEGEATSAAGEDVFCANWPVEIRADIRTLPLNYVLSCPLTPLVFACLPLVMACVVNFLKMSGLEANSPCGRYWQEILTEQENVKASIIGARQSATSNSREMTCRHLQQVKLTLFRLLSTLLKVGMASVLYEDKPAAEKTSQLNVFVEWMRALCEYELLRPVSCDVKETLMTHVIFGGFLHGFDNPGLPSSPKEVLPLDPSVFFFPTRSSHHWHYSLIRCFATETCLGQIMKDVCTYWMEVHQSSERLRGTETEDEAERSAHLTHVSRISGYTRSVAMGIDSLLGVPKTQQGKHVNEDDEGAETGGITPAEKVLTVDPTDTIIALRLIMNHSLKIQMLAEGTIIDTLLECLLRLNKIPGPDIVLLAQQAIKTLAKIPWRRYGGAHLDNSNESILRNQLDKFSAQCQHAISTIVAQCFNPFFGDPTQIDPIDLSTLPPNALAIGLPFPILQHIIGVPSTSRMRQFLILPTSVSTSGVIEKVLLNSQLEPAGFWSNTIATLYELFRAASLTFVARCNLLTLKRPLFAPHTTSEEVLMLLTLDPAFQDTITLLGNSTIFPYSLPAAQLGEWLHNMCGGKPKHDSKRAKEDIRVFLLENFNHLVGAERSDINEWRSKVKMLSDAHVAEKTQRRRRSSIGVNPGIDQLFL